MIDEMGVPFCTMAVSCVSRLCDPLELAFAPEVNPARRFENAEPFAVIAPESENQLRLLFNAVPVRADGTVPDGTIECREVTLLFSPPFF